MPTHPLDLSYFN